GGDVLVDAHVTSSVFVRVLDGRAHRVADVRVGAVAGTWLIGRDEAPLSPQGGLVHNFVRIRPGRRRARPPWRPFIWGNQISWPSAATTDENRAGLAELVPAWCARTRESD